MRIRLAAARWGRRRREVELGLALPRLDRPAGSATGRYDCVHLLQRECHVLSPARQQLHWQGLYYAAVACMMILSARDLKQASAAGPLLYEY